MRAQASHGAGRRWAGFAIVEAVVAAAVLVVAIAILAALAGGSRAHGQVSQSLANLKQLGEWTAAYGDDFAGLTPTFSWRRDYAPTTYPELQHPADDVQAGAFQAIDIIRRRSANPSVFVQGNFIAHVNYNTLVLADYSGVALPSQVRVSPADRALQDAIAGPPDPRQPLAPYSSSYESSNALYYAGETTDGGFLRSVGASFFQYSQGTLGLARLRPLPLALMRFPSQKALYYDREQRHFDRRVHFLFPSARVLVAVGDGSVALRRTADADRGGYTRFTGQRLEAPIEYAMAEPPAPPGESLSLTARYRFTFRQIAGRDFGAPLP